MTIKRSAQRATKQCRPKLLDKIMMIRWTAAEYTQLAYLAKVEGYSNVTEIIRRTLRLKLATPMTKGDH
jgi:hypothetical protein